MEGIGIEIGVGVEVEVEGGRKPPFRSLLFVFEVDLSLEVTLKVRLKRVL